MYKLTKKEYTEKSVNDVKTAYISFEGVMPDLSKYGGKSLYLINENPTVINGITIPSWTHWFFPLYSSGDCVGYAVYPDASSFYIIGHTSSGFYARKVY